jgi:hypothetical protein
MYSSYGSYNRREPFFVLGKFPMHITQLVVVALIAGLVCTIFLGAANIFGSAAFAINGNSSPKWWTPFTYIWFTVPSFWNIVGLIFFVIYGSRVEADLERKWFAGLMVYLWLVPPLLLWAASALGGVFLAGPYLVGTSVFLAYSFMHPHQMIWSVIPMKWFGLIIMVAAIGQDIAFRQWPMAIAESILWLGMYGLLRYLGNAREWHLLADMGFSWERNPTPSHQKTLSNSRRSPKLKPRTVIDLKRSRAVDVILDKINTEGIHSLTEKEKALLKNTSDEFAE